MLSECVCEWMDVSQDRVRPGHPVRARQRPGCIRGLDREYQLPDIGSAVTVVHEGMQHEVASPLFPDLPCYTVSVQS
jgi:hypothetical protein